MCPSHPGSRQQQCPLRSIRNGFYFQCALLKLGKIWYTSFDGETLKNVAKPVGVIEEPIVELPKASLGYQHTRTARAAGYEFS